MGPVDLSEGALSGFVCLQSVEVSSQEQDTGASAKLRLGRADQTALAGDRLHCMARQMAIPTVHRLPEKTLTHLIC